MSTNTSQADPVARLISVLDAVDALPGAAELRQRTYELLRAAPGVRAVDVGCGAGRAVAELTGLGVRCVGVDPSDTMLAAARRRWPGLEFEQGTAEALPLGDGTCAGYRADKVFHELSEPGRAIREAWRVLEPGGRVVLVGQDWETLVIDSGDPALTRALVQARAGTVASPRAARGYRNLLLDQGFTEVSVEVHTAVLTEATMLPVVTGLAHSGAESGAVSAEQAEVWLAEQQQRAADGRLFIAIPMFLASATRP
ncbi:methyltransferase domain-containing protein [Amycolatopsis sp. NPDC006131]|uniref:methyltransferase domain-containing protein n=1 Tax=Amycolatopsis sp. NPDC006131 TaxID=3156731 RepID=UPI0033A121FC